MKNKMIATLAVLLLGAASTAFAGTRAWIGSTPPEQPAPQGQISSI